jgi:predicted house-cleaning noncanonical NTP pyrophosphatase (MazG superfamily)
VSARRIHEKLVRDRIPEILDRAGVRYAVVPLAPEAFRERLRAKVSEEANEVAAAASRGELVDEIADLCEVLASLMALHGIAAADVEAARQRRASERGTFDARLSLLWTESGE